MPWGTCCSASSIFLKFPQVSLNLLCFKLVCAVMASSLAHKKRANAASQLALPSCAPH